MQYLGGKSGSVGSIIAGHVSDALTPGCQFVDMFCGSLNIVRHVRHEHRTAVDANGPLITMWRAAAAGWIPPIKVSAEEYSHVKKHQDPHDPMTAFVMFGCSFGGKWGGGYAKDRPQQRYAECASNVIRAKIKDCIGVNFEHRTFMSFHPGCWEPGTVVYCDPPYAGTTGYKALEPFDADSFWRWAGEHRNRGVKVFVSEYSAPAGWSIVASQVACQGGRLTKGKKPRVDLLFR